MALIHNGGVVHTRATNVLQQVQHCALAVGNARRCLLETGRLCTASTACCDVVDAAFAGAFSSPCPVFFLFLFFALVSSFGLLCPCALGLPCRAAHIQVARAAALGAALCGTRCCALGALYNDVPQHSWPTLE